MFVFLTTWLRLIVIIMLTEQLLLQHCRTMNIIKNSKITHMTIVSQYGCVWQLASRLDLQLHKQLSVERLLKDE